MLLTTVPMIPDHWLCCWELWPTASGVQHVDYPCFTETKEIIIKIIIVVTLSSYFQLLFSERSLSTEMTIQFVKICLFSRLLVGSPWSGYPGNRMGDVYKCDVNQPGTQCSKMNLQSKF